MIITLNEISLPHIAKDLTYQANIKLLDTYILSSDFPWIFDDVCKNWLTENFVFNETYEYNVLVTQFIRMLNI